jgi:hypothetical protein
MDAFFKKQMLTLASELATSHGTFFAAALLAEVGVPLQLALTTLACRPQLDKVIICPETRSSFCK